MKKLFHLAACFWCMALGSAAKAEQACVPIHISFQNRRAHIETDIACQVHNDPILAHQLLAHAKRDLKLDRQTAMHVHMSVPSNVETKTEVTFANDAVISLLERRDEYFGGPHGMTEFRSLTWDRAHHWPIPLSDLLIEARKTGPTLTALAQRTRAKLAADWRNKNPPVVVNDPDENWKYLIEANLTTFENWTLEAGDRDKASGIAIYFAPYRVSGYADGVQRVFLTFDSIKDLIKPKYHKLFIQ